MRVEVRGLTVRYGDVPAVDDLSFTLAENKVHGLLGRNGAGKSSLMSVLASFRKPTGGTVLVDGQPVFENRRVTSRVCLVQHGVDPADKGDRVQDALSYAGDLRETWDAGYAERLVELFRLPTGKKLSGLSLGQRSAFGVVVGLAGRAPLTMFDEAHLGMDTPTRFAFYDELLADFMAHPRTFLLSTHLIEELAPLLEEVLIIDSGRLVLHEETDAVRARGTSVTGPVGAVDRFVADLTVLDQKELGPTKSAMVHGTLDDGRRAEAARAGLDLGPIALHDLFVHLTEPAGSARR
ncbi:ABC transporter ATP-binding protein [Umezawaea sp. Da 62-37]|uniref:ABC transporter ATP-binding protein n=1 Tax=Umezawaea sp. Da 62-37 TaxID=3075927 RepID=UPI0028F7115C|nr:ABC transporter ATP-binding protein [Umezawaea sp. Da 62-37]WNV82022.1 ABC transporter ATP-binding protein [Umezawaea sp. Da 62-37]